MTLGAGGSGRKIEARTVGFEGQLLPFVHQRPPQPWHCAFQVEMDCESSETLI